MQKSRAEVKYFRKARIVRVAEEEKKGRNWAWKNGKKRALITQNHKRNLKITAYSIDWIDNKDGIIKIDKRLRPLIMRLYGYL